MRSKKPAVHQDHRFFIRKLLHRHATTGMPKAHHPSAWFSSPVHHPERYEAQWPDPTCWNLLGYPLRFRSICHTNLIRKIVHYLISHQGRIMCVCQKYPFLSNSHVQQVRFLMKYHIIVFFITIYPCIIKLFIYIFMSYLKRAVSCRFLRRLRGKTRGGLFLFEKGA